MTDPYRKCHHGVDRPPAAVVNPDGSIATTLVADVPATDAYPITD